jgi:hypothetical protein
MKGEPCGVHYYIKIFARERLTTATGQYWSKPFYIRSSENCAVSEYFGSAAALWYLASTKCSMHRWSRAVNHVAWFVRTLCSVLENWSWKWCWIKRLVILLHASLILLQNGVPVAVKLDWIIKDCQDSWDGIAMGWMVQVPFPERQDFSLLHSVQTPWGRPSLLSNGYWGCFPRGKVAEVWNWSLTSHLVPSSRIVELYLHFPIMSSWHSA